MPTNAKPCPLRNDIVILDAMVCGGLSGLDLVGYTEGSIPHSTTGGARATAPMTSRPSLMGRWTKRSTHKSTCLINTAILAP